MKKTYFLKTLFVAACLLAGVNATWAQGNKRVLDSQDYESSTTADWTSPNGTVSLKTGDATYGKYAQVDVSGNGNRSCYKTASYAYDSDAYTTAEMTTKGYVIEFDLRMAGGHQKDRSVAQFIVPTIGPNLATNGAYSGSDYIFALSQPTNTTGKAETTWYVNDLTNTNNAITLTDSWYHYKLVVSESSVSYTITKGEDTPITGSLTVTSLPQIKGFFALTGRTYGRISFDNFDMYDYTAALTVSAPTFTFDRVNGANREYTITNTDGSGTLYYTTAPAEEAPEVGDAAYSSTIDLTKSVSFSESGKYYAYVLHTNGTTTSVITEQTVTAGALTLAAPVFTVVDMVQAEDGFYYPQVTFASNNSSLEGAPTASLDQVSPYTFTGTGSLTVTASADGYTSSSATFTVTNKYSVSKFINFGTLTASDFDENVWETATGAPRDYWTNRAAAIPADVTYYKLKNTSSELVNPDNSAVLEGITILNYHQRAPQVYIGYGLLTPYDAISGSSNNMNFTVNGGTAEDYIVYNGWNNYGNGTFNTVQAGNATFGLYRYDTMLRTIKVYSPAPTVTITAAGYATYCSPYALNFEGTGLTAYRATVADKYVSFTPVTSVPAGEGVLLKGDAGSYNIPTIASASAIENAFIGVTEETTAPVGSFVLMGSPKVGFYKTKSAFTVGAHTAYLPASVAEGRSFIGFDDETTGISSLTTSSKSEGSIYNLNGQRVQKAKKGLYIQNGKKFVVK